MERRIKKVGEGWFFAPSVVRRGMLNGEQQLFPPDLAWGFFSRHGGESLAPHDSLNVSFGVGDDPVRVRRNRQRIKEKLGLAVLASAQQVHGERILALDAPLAADQEFPGYDALITNQPGMGLMIQQADCQAILLHDPMRRVIGNIHAGWRGSVAKTIAKTIAAMVARYGINPGDLRAAISPSLGPCCAEFVNHQEELPREFHDYQVRPNYFDFWALSRDQLQSAGVPEGQIAINGRCTVCDRDYFSYRREGQTGRFCSVIALKEETTHGRHSAR